MTKRAAVPAEPVPDILEPEATRLEALWAEARTPLLWSFAAFGALTLATLAALTERGDRRLGELPAAVETALSRPAEPQRLARTDMDAASRRIAMERAQLEARLADLERAVGEVTGSIARTQREPESRTELAPVTGTIAAPAPPAPAPAAAPAGGVTLATRALFGVDLGGETTLQAVRLRWQRASERHGGVISTYEPIVVVREQPDGRVLLHLVAGPLGDVQEAAALCARLRSSGTHCAPASYEGQRLAQR